jgi:predicted lactoylglutathione lyase
MNSLIKMFMLLLAADGGGGGAAPAPAAPPQTAPAPPAAPTQTSPPPKTDTPSTGTPPAPEGEVDEEWKGWWAAQLQKETREKHRDGLLGLKGKQLGEVFDDFFSSRTKLQNAVVFPGKDATPEEIDAFLKRMDIPKTAEEYSLDPKLIPSSDITDEKKAEAAKGLADFYKSIGLTKNQATGMYQQYTAMIKDIIEAGATRQKALADTFEERLLKEAGDEKAATETKEYFKRALIALGDKQLVQELSQSGMMYSTAFVRGLADIWKAGNQEPPIIQGSGSKEDTAKDALPKGKQFEERYGSRRK